MSRKYYTVNPTWFKGYRPDLTKDVIVFGEDNDQAKTDSCLAILWYPTGPKLDADFDEWALLSHERTLLDLLAGAGLTHGKDLTVEQVRSEEHTSELQSRPHLVCRLLLEKKKKTNRGDRGHRS